MEQGVCPVDLLRYLFDNDMVPAARWPSAKDTSILHDNWDFLARLYLQKYYRAD